MLFSIMIFHDQHSSNTLKKQIPATNQGSHRMTRRHFLYGCGLLGASVLMSPTAGFGMSVPAIKPVERRISLLNLHTGERVENLPYFADGEFVSESLTSLNRLLRDHRNGDMCSIDPELFDQLWGLRQTLGNDSSFHVISGYRSPESNQKLAAQSNGVAKRSMHTFGRAIDIRLPGVDLATLRKSALAMKKGGVGYYPKDNFVHIDTGRVRFW